jgi:hypothetical protein
MDRHGPPWTAAHLGAGMAGNGCYVQLAARVAWEPTWGGVQQMIVFFASGRPTLQTPGSGWFGSKKSGITINVQLRYV